MRHIIAVLFENEAGALARIAGLFAQRNVNIETLSVAPTNDETLARLTLVTEANDTTVEQVTKHLNRLVEVLKVVDLSEIIHVERELLLVKVRTEPTMREEIKRTCDIFRGQIIDVTATTYTIQLVGPSEKLDAFLDAVGAAQTLEVVRSGVLGLGRGAKFLSI